MTEKSPTSSRTLSDVVPRIIDALRRYAEAEFKSPLGKIDLMIIAIAFVLAVVSPLNIPHLRDANIIFSSILMLALLAIISAVIAEDKYKKGYLADRERNP